MSSNLIFHVVSRRKWKEFNKGGYYDPKGSKYEDGIVCLESENLKDYINSNFRGRRQILLLVIDKSRLVSNMEKKGEYLMVKDKINMDAILDKILIKPDKDGIFHIDIEEG